MNTSLKLNTLMTTELPNSPHWEQAAMHEIFVSWKQNTTTLQTLQSIVIESIKHETIGGVNSMPKISMICPYSS